MTPRRTHAARALARTLTRAFALDLDRAVATARALDLDLDPARAIARARHLDRSRQMSRGPAHGHRPAVTHPDSLDRSPEHRQDDAAARRPGLKPARNARRAVGLAVRLLPAANRPRYREEFLAELADVTGNRQRASHLVRVLCTTWTLRRELSTDKAAPKVS
jgi:hypothetical protein